MHKVVRVFRKTAGHAFRFWRRVILRIRAEIMLATAREVTLSGVRVPIGRHISPRVLDPIRRRVYEGAELELLGRSLRDDDVVLELGTGLGVLATFCAQRLGSAAVHTFEANAALFPHVQQLFALNGVAPNASVAAVGPRSGQLEFFTGKDFWSGSLVPAPGLSVRHTVPVRALSELLSTIRPTYLIVDIEGAEHPLLVEQPIDGVRVLLLEKHPGVLGPDKLAELDTALDRQEFEVVGTAHLSRLYARRPDFDRARTT